MLLEILLLYDCAYTDGNNELLLEHVQGCVFYTLEAQS